MLVSTSKHNVHFSFIHSLSQQRQEGRFLYINFSAKFSFASETPPCVLWNDYYSRRQLKVHTFQYLGTLKYRNPYDPCWRANSIFKFQRDYYEWDQIPLLLS